MKRPQLASSTSIDRMLTAARDAWNQSAFENSIELMERASRLDPANPAILLELGRYYGLRYDYANAERCFEKAIRLAQPKSRILMAAGEKCHAFAQQDIAERYFKRAAEEKDAPPEALAQLAEIYERRHQLNDAAELVNRALQLNATCGIALVARARLERQAGRLEQAEGVIRSLLAQPDPGTQQTRARGTRVGAWYELGAILDKQKRFDEAMAAFLQAKSMLRLHAAPFFAEWKRTRAASHQVREQLTAALLHSRHDFGQHLSPPRRLALLGGHPRSGTTLLEQVLDSHPDIVTAEETPIFAEDAFAPFARSPAAADPNPSVLATALQRSRADYFRSMESFLGESIGERLLIDKNPSLTFMAPFLIQVFPEIKFLMALRDPRDVCLSVFVQAFPPTNPAFLSLEGTVEEYIALMSMWTTIRDLMKNPWLEVRYEDIVQDLESVSRKVLNFLAVPWDPNVLHFDEHARQKQVRSPSYADVAKPLFKTAVGRWRNYQKYFEPHLSKLEPFVKMFGYD